MSEARKYSLSLIMAHQNLSQLPKDLQDSILTNCGIQCYFRVCRRDAERLAKEAFETSGIEVKAVKLSREYSEFKKKFYEFAKLPQEGGKGLIEFTKLGKSFCYWLSKWGEIAFAEKFGMPSDRAINELGGGGKP
ncbi:MAG: hypothetical protein QXJ62_02255 [Nitrososphaeria archaeon]